MTEAQGVEVIAKLTELIAWVQVACKWLGFLGELGSNLFLLLLFVAACVGVSALTQMLRRG